MFEALSCRRGSRCAGPGFWCILQHTGATSQQQLPRLRGLWSLRNIAQRDLVKHSSIPLKNDACVGFFFYLIPVMALYFQVRKVDGKVTEL